ncbi:hypothetical protein RRF57_005338 [Xylaria bambusicola]|uniref:cyclic pyranopterin monophosphate synthase n=1 Tax=Xylaria bambusicola TaxID=326684 RepID=A0AAN7UHR2_9PEZI
MKVRLADPQSPRLDDHHKTLRGAPLANQTIQGSYLLNGLMPLPTSSSRIHSQQLRYFSNARRQLGLPEDGSKLTHVSESGTAHMVSISDKSPTKRLAKAVCSVRFADKTACRLIQENQIQKGDVLGVARIAGIMAAKKTSHLIPLCHPISLSKVTVDLQVVQGLDDVGRVDIQATVTCEGKTGVEMEALTAASTAALTIYDMCKAVDKRMTIEGLKVVLKEGGKSGRWIDGMQDGSPTLET